MVQLNFIFCKQYRYGVFLAYRQLLGVEGFFTLKTADVDGVNNYTSGVKRAI